MKWGSTNAYTEDAAGNPIYDWTILDQIFDTYLERGVRPYVQIGFMPKALSIKPDPYQHHWTPQARYDEIYTGWAYPPKDYAKWGELAYQWTRHCVDRYGRAEVEKWYWEVWNEPNIGYWRGTAEEFRKLHDFALDGVRRALPTARVGGCDSAGGGGPFLRDFIENSLRGTNFATGQTGTPLQFVSFHAKGAPTYIPAPAGTEGTGHVRMGISNQLRTIDSTFGLIASYPELRDAPLVIGESDPDGCAACQGPQLGYRNTTMYSSYTAASFARKHLLAAKHQVNLEGALTWAFEFEDAPLFAGYRVLATGGIDLPVLNVFRMFSRMGSERISSSSSAMTPLEEIVARGVRGERPDVGVLASRVEKRVAVLVWHYHDDDLPGPDALIALSLAGLPAGRRKSKSAITHWRIDHEHSNSYTAFQKMGSPLTPTADQYAALKAAGQLEQLKEGLSTQPASNADGLSLSFRLPRQGISLIEIEV